MDKKILTLKGISASLGQVTGTVRVLLFAEDSDLLKMGEILVTRRTSVDFMVAIKKAAAIVTDLGGITCHAAIIARELDIPCIVGTKIATKVLKTGDWVEVDANSGIVRVLN